MENDQQKQTLGDIPSSIGSSVHKFHVLMGENLGSRTLKLCMPLRKFIEISAVANKQTISENDLFSSEHVAQRPLDKNHATSLAKYTLMGLVRAQINGMDEVGEEIAAIKDHLGDPPYTSLQPIVVNIRACKPGGADIRLEDNGGVEGVAKIALTDEQILWVIDGQHRRVSFEMVMDFLKAVARTYRYPKRGVFRPADYDDSPISEQIHSFWQKILESAMSRATVSVEAHLGLNESQEQQLFFDLNSKGKKVSMSLSYSYDHTDPVNVFVKNQLLDHETRFPFSISEVDHADWHLDDGSMRRKDLNSICSFLISGKGNSRGITPAQVSEKAKFALGFWDRIFSIPGFAREGAKSKIVAAQPVVLKALAKLAYDLGYGNRNLVDPQGLKILYEAIDSGDLDFTHNNPMWKVPLVEKEAREELLPGVNGYMFVPAATNLDAGTFDKETSWVRFGSRHNDIYPRLGDIIRCKLRLNPRKTVVRAIEREKQEEGQV